MKKALYTLMMAVTLVSVLAACQKNDDDGGGGTQAPTYGATPTPTPCGVPGGDCTNSYYQQFPQFEGYQWSNANGFCGCRPGFRPVMNAQWGISCAPDNWVSNYYGNGYLGPSAYYSFSFQATLEIYHGQNGQWSSIPQVTYSPAAANPFGGNCYTEAASVCDVRVANSCPNGGYCRTTGGGSYIGLCTNTPGIERYNMPQGQACWTDWWGYRVCSFGYNSYYGYKNQVPDGRNPR